MAGVDASGSCDRASRNPERRSQRQREERWIGDAAAAAATSTENSASPGSSTPGATGREMKPRRRRREGSTASSHPAGSAPSPSPQWGRQRQQQRCMAVLLAIAVANALAPKADGCRRGREEAVPVSSLAMQGGGFRALAADAGFFSGLLAAAARHEGARTPDLASSGLLDNICQMSTNSGSSWFMSELIYSPKFVQLVERMAATPWRAAHNFAHFWTEPWLRATRIDVPFFNVTGNLARAVVRALLGSADADTILLARFLLATGVTWTNFVNTLLNSTAGLDESVQLGSPVNSWAEGKLWIVDHTAVFPQGGTVGRFYEAILGKETVAYRELNEASTGDKVNFQPARLSIILGAGIDSAAPLPYIPPSAPPLTRRLNYTARNRTGDGVQFSTLSGPLDFGSLMRDAGKLPVTRVVGASSAFLGTAATLGPVPAQAEALLSASLTPWISSAPEGRAFHEADKLIATVKTGQESLPFALNGLANSGVRGVIDGGFCEGTGIAEAVAAGADEVVVVLNSNASNNPYFVQLLFPGGLDPSNEPHVNAFSKPAALFPVFAAPSAAAVRKAFADDFHLLRLPLRAKFLHALAVGTLHVRTAENVFWGIEANRNVTLHIVNIASELKIGLLEDFNHYNFLVQEVISTLTSGWNRGVVESVLLPLFLRSRDASGGQRRPADADTDAADKAVGLAFSQTHALMVPPAYI